MATYPRSELPKACSMCKQVKPALDFYTNASTPSGLQGRCKPCHKVARSLVTYPRSELPKKCIRCEQVKPALDFFADPQNRDGLQGCCKPCYGLDTRYRKYQLSEGDYTAILEAQGNACAICSDQFTDKLVPHVDHDHACCPGWKSCGVCVRGLLCGPCNKGIGCLKDDPQRLRQAALYLERTEVASV